MVHSDSGSNILVENPVSVVAADKSAGHRGSPSLRREPSFSGWCDSSKLHADRELLENANLNLDKEQEGVGRGGTDCDFELPLLNQEQSFGSLSCSSFSMESRVIDGENGHIQYTTFDVENASKTEQNFNTFGDDNGVAASGNGTHFIRNYDGSTPNSTKTVSTANVLKTLFFVMLWYTFSLFLTMYNKALLGDHLGKFPAPLLMNTLHFSMQAVLSRAIIWFWPDKYQTDVTISWKDYFARVVPTAFATALDINLSNASLVFISVTFATMCKSAAPIFLLLFAFALRLESPSFKLFGIILVISFGVLLTVAKETEFDFWGFVFVMFAAVMSGFRWCMIQILLQRETYGLKNPIVFMSSVTPVMALATGLMSLALDPWHEFATNVYFNSSQHIFRSCLLMLFGGTLAFFMVLVEFVLISVTSAVTVTIAGVVKEALTIVVAVLYFHDEFTWVKGIGLLVIMFGVSLFNWYKYLKIQSGHGAADETEQSVTSAAKYVILDKMEDQDENM